MAVTINLNRNLRLLGMTYTQLLTIGFPPILSAGVMYIMVLLAHSGMFLDISATVRLPMETA